MNDYSGLQARIVGLEKDVEYLKSEHKEFKQFMKRFEAVPYQIESINEKMDTLLDRVKTVEEESEEDAATKSRFDWGAEWIKYVAIAIVGIVVIIGSILGVPIPFIGGN